MPEFTLEQALKGLGIEADEVLDYKVHSDHIVVILIRGSKLIWPLPLKPADAEAPAEIRVSGEAQRVAAEMDVDLKEIGGSGAGGKVSAKDVRLAASKKRAGKG